MQRSYYYETHDKDGNITSNETEDEWRKRIIAEIAVSGVMIGKKIVKIYLIFHDKDFDENGNPKGLHCHAVVWFENGVFPNVAMARLGCSRQKNCFNPADLVQALRYLIHVSKKSLNEDKHIYSPDEVIAVSADTQKPIEPYRKAIQDSDRKQKKQTAMDGQNQKALAKQAMSTLLEETATGKRTITTIPAIYKTDSLKVGFTLADWYTHKSKYVEAEREYFNHIMEHYNRNPRCLTTIYICGDGGVGKSELGFHLANYFFPDCPVHRPATAGAQTTFDFAGDYHGEHVTIFNEFSACFPVAQFCDVFDPIHANAVNSRNNDKPWFADLAIFPTSVELEQTIYNMWYSYAKSELRKLNCSNSFWGMTQEDTLRNIEMANDGVADKIRQIRRRFNVMVRLVNDSAEIYYLDYSKNLPHVFLYNDPEFTVNPYTHFATCGYNVNDPKSIEDTVKNVSGAIFEYYKQNKHTITPWNTHRPEITI
jgi:hypothetical protein